MKIRLGGEWGINSSVHPSQKVGGETRKQRCCSADKCLFCCVRVGERYGMVHLVKQERWGGGTTQSFVGEGMEKEAIF